ncbi:unnamed protein product [Amoebophrya sp. A25]|nr:unnamed protein product [Amoebophrya sp. A25]|eukprot:GSA25T00026729001.1
MAHIKRANGVAQPFNLLKSLMHEVEIRKIIDLADEHEPAYHKPSLAMKLARDAFLHLKKVERFGAAKYGALEFPGRLEEAEENCILLLRLLSAGELNALGFEACLYISEKKPDHEFFVPNRRLGPWGAGDCFRSRWRYLYKQGYRQDSHDEKWEPRPGVCCHGFDKPGHFVRSLRDVSRDVRCVDSRQRNLVWASMIMTGDGRLFDEMVYASKKHKDWKLVPPRHPCLDEIVRESVARVLSQEENPRNGRPLDLGALLDLNSLDQLDLQGNHLRDSFEQHARRSLEWNFCRADARWIDSDLGCMPVLGEEEWNLYPKHEFWADLIQKKLQLLYLKTVQPLAFRIPVPPRNLEIREAFLFYDFDWLSLLKTIYCWPEETRKEVIHSSVMDLRDLIGNMFSIMDWEEALGRDLFDADGYAECLYYLAAILVRNREAFPTFAGEQVALVLSCNFRTSTDTKAADRLDTKRLVKAMDAQIRASDLAELRLFENRRSSVSDYFGFLQKLTEEPKLLNFVDPSLLVNYFSWLDKELPRLRGAADNLIGRPRLGAFDFGPDSENEE